MLEDTNSLDGAHVIVKLLIILYFVLSNNVIDYKDDKNSFLHFHSFPTVRCIIYIWATTRQNVSSGVSDQARHKPACAATEAS